MGRPVRRLVRSIRRWDADDDPRLRHHPRRRLGWRRSLARIPNNHRPPRRRATPRARARIRRRRDQCRRLCSGTGCRSIVFVDDDPDRRALATQLGALAFAGPPDRAHGRVDLVVDASSTQRGCAGPLICSCPRERSVRRSFLRRPHAADSGDVGKGSHLHIGRADTGPHVALRSHARTARASAHRWSTPIDWPDIADTLSDPPLKPVAIRSSQTARA